STLATTARRSQLQMMPPIPSVRLRRRRERTFGFLAVEGYFEVCLLVDTIEVAVMPIALSQGIPLLPAGERSPRLRLVDSKVSHSGILSLNYAIQYRGSRKKPKKAKKRPKAPEPTSRDVAHL